MARVELDVDLAEIADDVTTVELVEELAARAVAGDRSFREIGRAVQKLEPAAAAALQDAVNEKPIPAPERTLYPEWTRRKLEEIGLAPQA